MSLDTTTRPTAKPAAKQRLTLTDLAANHLVSVHNVSQDEFETWTDEDTRAEWLDDEMVVHSPAAVLHEALVLFLGHLIGGYADERQAGLVVVGNALFRISPTRLVAPDVAFIRADRLTDPLPAKFDGPPDLTMEVLSPSTRGYDLGRKRKLYQESGTPELWLIDPDQPEVIVSRRGDKGYVSSTHQTGRVISESLPGFWLDVAWLAGQKLPSRQACLMAMLEDSTPG